MNKELRSAIMDAVSDSSGGLKFPELIAKLPKKFAGTDPDVLEEEIRDMPELKILDYTWVPMMRAKMFVYTP